MNAQFFFASFATILLINVAEAAGTDIVFSDGFSDESSLSSKWNIAADSSDVTVDLQDYRYVITSTGIGIPEAPNSNLLPGPARTGVFFRANRFSGVAAAVGLISQEVFDMRQFEFQFDVYLSTGSQALTHYNSTETAVWGVGRSTEDPLSYANRNTLGDGVWGWLATDNGFLLEDTALYKNTLALADLGETRDPEAPSLFNAAFTPDPGITHSAPLNDWVTVKLVYDGANMKVLFNDVQFFTEAVGDIGGHLFVGYADPFDSVSSSPSLQWGVIDNVILRDTSAIPEPATLSLVCLGLLGLGWRGR